MQAAKQTEEEFMFKIALSPDGHPANKSGSCALVIMVVNEEIYIINVGDSRALTSKSYQDGLGYVS
jgi:serine/threonine protein phosphatase PrpC